MVTGHHGADTDRSKKRREQNEKMQGIAPDADCMYDFVIMLSISKYVLINLHYEKL